MSLLINSLLTGL